MTKHVIFLDVQWYIHSDILSLLAFCAWQNLRSEIFSTSDMYTRIPLRPPCTTKRSIYLASSETRYYKTNSVNEIKRNCFTTSQSISETQQRKRFAKIYVFQARTALSLGKTARISVAKGDGYSMDASRRDKRHSYEKRSHCWCG